MKMLIIIRLFIIIINQSSKVIMVTIIKKLRCEHKMYMVQPMKQKSNPLLSEHADRLFSNPEWIQQKNAST